MAPEEEIRQLSLPHDPGWLSEALINILENGVKYSPSGSQMQIITRQRSTCLRIEIADEGIGIPREEQGKIFQRFYRGSSPLVKEVSGSGVGLYLSREIIRKHGGTITVKSDNGRTMGSTFVIQLPLHQA
jgi:signal transduction histidine kinase